MTDHAQPIEYHWVMTLQSGPRAVTLEGTMESNMTAQVRYRAIYDEAIKTLKASDPGLVNAHVLFWSCTPNRASDA